MLGSQLSYANERLIIVSSQNGKASELNAHSGQGTALYTYSKDQQSQLEILADQNKRMQLEVFQQNQKADPEWE
jgi:hypothetical protein